mmetsp:Transcript_8321/g.14096  ORF Transcript_8321/g.14096 Transcript_8321/m.14096 type:complete len:283 (+) Transcript_8321:1484-2332(+)
MHSLVKSMQEILLRGTVLGGHEPEANERAEHTEASQPERKSNQRNITIGKSDTGNDGSNERLKKISSHTGNITHVVAHVVSNDSRVSRIILRDSLLNLSDKISTNISSLGVDTTSDTGEKGNRRSTKTKASQRLGGPLVDNGVVRVHHGVHIVINVAGRAAHSHEAKEDRHSGKAKANHTETHDSTTRESNLKGFIETLLIGGMSGAAVGISSNNHTDPTGEGRKRSTSEEAKANADTITAILARRRQTEHDNENNKDSGDKASQVLVLSDQKGARTRGDGV